MAWCSVLRWGWCSVERRGAGYCSLTLCVVGDDIACHSWCNVAYHCIVWCDMSLHGVMCFVLPLCDVMWHAIAWCGVVVCGGVLWHCAA